MTVRALARPSEPGSEAVESLRLRATELLPAGFEEIVEDGRLLVVAYAESSDELPPELGPWTVEDVASDWAERWRDFHVGRLVGGRLFIGPPWETPPPGVASVLIDPGRAFGTGGHATTLASLELLVAQPAGGALLDLGCGSGVLSIAALRLGFSPVHACDIDPICLEVTRENAARNDVALEPFCADALADPLPDAPLWIANILRGPLEQILARPDAAPTVIVSGLLQHEVLAAPAHRVERRVVLDGWQALLLVRR
ncbi:MAG: 50S ribosomal protein L11 methyltransferase [Gaiellales bacterium]